MIAYFLQNIKRLLKTPYRYVRRLFLHYFCVMVSVKLNLTSVGVTLPIMERQKAIECCSFLLPVNQIL